MFEFQVGGRWKFVMHGPDGQSYPNECLFTALEPGALVVIDHVCAPLFVLSVRLEPAPGWHPADLGADLCRCPHRAGCAYHRGAGQ
jgi:hypothetical protein